MTALDVYGITLKLSAQPRLMGGQILVTFVGQIDDFRKAELAVEEVM